MPMDCYFDENDPSLLWLHIHGGISWDAYDQATDEAAARIQEQPHRVDVIYKVETRAPIGNPIPHFKRALDIFAELPNFGVGVTVMLIPANFAKESLAFVRNTYRPSQRDRYFVVDTIEEALRIIQHARDAN